MHKRYWVAITLLAALPAGAQVTTASTPAPGTAVPDERDQLIRQRYEQVLERDPLQDAAFERVYESYMLSDGVDAWLEKLKPAEGQTESAGSLILRGRILARQFKTADAVEALSKARTLGENGPAFNALLGRLYYETGKDADAITLLSAALDATGSPEQRSELCRMLGSVYLRAGKRTEAAGVWERIAELNPGDLFALQELAEIYEENRLWDEAIAARKRIVEAATNDPYRQCNAWRAIGQSLLEKEDPAGAIAAFEQGLALAAPGNWLFEDLKGRLVAVYESRGDLEGLSTYLEARIAQDASDLSLSELLADVTLRRGDTAKAEGILKDIVAREPGRVSALEKLIELYRQAGRAEDLAATFETLIAQYPAEPDYLRRLGEAWLEQKSPEKAQAAWRRILGDGSKAADHALLAEWLERSEFFPEAATEYEAALAIQPDREWRLRLAGLKYDMGEEEAALAAWQAAVAPEDTPAAEVAEIAAILASKEFKTEAEVLYSRAMDLEPENLDYVLAYARLLSGRGDHAAAAVQYTRLAEQDGSEYLRGEGERGLLDAYEAQGTLETQRATWEEAITQTPGDTASRLKLARLYARLGNRPGVVKIYEECAAIDPARLEFQRLLAAAYKENRQTEKAVSVLEGLIEKDGERAQAYLRDLLVLYGTLGRGGESIRSAEKLVELSPSSPEARTALAQVYLRNGEAEKGLQQYRDLIRLDPNQSGYFKEFGDALQQTGKFGEAQEVYRKMLDTATDDNTRLDAVNRLAQVYVRNGQRDVLLAEFQRRVTAAPKSLPAYQELAAVYRAAGDARSALETLERARGEVEDKDAVLRLVMAEAYQSGDQQKVVTAYEELLARSAKPTPLDLDRLASAYAQVGRLDEAQEIWKKIAAEHPDDAALQLMVARQLESQGLYEESNEGIERVLAIDPFDHALRFEYAQRLLSNNEVERGLEQLQKILDIGERPAAAPANAVSPASPPQNSGLLSGMVVSSQASGFPGSRARNRGQSYEDLRQQVVQMMVQLSRQYDGSPSVLETYRKRIEAQPDNTDARRDFLLVCEASGENALALDTARDLLLRQPDDDTLRWRIFGYLQELGQIDEAIAVAAELSNRPNSVLSSQARLMHIRLLAQRKRFDEAEAVLAEITADPPAMAQIYFQVAASFQEAADPEVAERLYQKAAELDPGMRHQALTGRARLCQERGDGPAARNFYLEAVFLPKPEGPDNANLNPGRIPASLYMPQGARRGRQSGNAIAQLPGYNYILMDYQRAEALNQVYRLCATPEEFEPVIERLRAASAGYTTAETDEPRRESSNYASFLVAVLRNLGRGSEAISVVQSLLAERPGDLPLQNMALFLYDEEGRFDDMKNIYTSVETAVPSLADEVARARLQLALVQEDIAAIPGLYRELSARVAQGNARTPRGARGGQLAAVVRVLENSGARAEARALIEEELTHSRDAANLILLSRSYLAERNYDQAIALAREAYDKQGGARVRGSNNQYSMNALALQSQGLFGLEMLWNAYREAGRESELIAEFESRLEGQPTSVSLRQALAGLYVENHQYDLARAQMEKLLELRPNDLQLQIRYAGLLEASNDPAGALARLESVNASRPSAGRGITSEIQRLYKELGKKEALGALQERMIHEARSAEELQQLARDLGEQKDYGRAAELLQRAQRIEPENTWLYVQMGDLLWQGDKKSEAAQAYLKFFQPATPQSVINIDIERAPEIIARIDTAGMLGDLKALAAGTASNEFSIRSLKVLEALIVKHEGRPEEAEQMLKALLSTGPDQQIYALLTNMAESRGDLAAAIQYLADTVAVSGFTDYRRLAKLYLRTGDTARSIQSWKKFADQQGGGYFGTEEALRSFDAAGAMDAVATYFREVRNALPDTDQAKQQLDNVLIRLNEETGRYDALIAEVIFDKSSRNTAELARLFLGYYDGIPGFARKRIASIVERFPDNSELQALYADVLEKAGDIDGALAVYGKLPRDDAFFDNIVQRYANLARAAGDRTTWQELMLASAARPNPSSADLSQASIALIEAGRRSELPAFREQQLQKCSDPGSQRQLRCDFAEFDAQQGDITVAHDALKALTEEAQDESVSMRYFQFLLQQGFDDEAADLFMNWPENRRERSVDKIGLQSVMRVLVHTGRSSVAWEVFSASLQRQFATSRENSQKLFGAFRALHVFSEFQVPAEMMEGFMKSVAEREPLSMADRIILAGTNIYMGRWPAILALLQDHREEPIVKNLIQYWRSSVPAELQEALLSLTPEVEHGEEKINAPVLDNRDEAAEWRPVRSAEALLREGKTAEAISALDAVVIGPGDFGLRQRRASVYERSGAFSNALADLDICIREQPDDIGLRVRRMILLVKLDRIPEAMTAWSSTHLPPACLELAQSLVESGHHAEAIEVLDGGSPRLQRIFQAVQLRARIMQQLERPADMIAAVEPLFEESDRNGKDQLITELGDLLHKSGLWKVVLGDEALRIKTLVSRALIQVAQQSGEDPAQMALLADAIPPSALGCRSDWMAFAQLLETLNRRDAASKALESATRLHPELNATDQQIAHALLRLEAYDAVGRVLLDCSEKRPELLGNGFEFGIYFLDLATDPAQRDALLERMVQLAPSDSMANYLNAVRTWYGPDRAAGLAAMDTLLADDTAQAAQLQSIVGLLNKVGDTARRIRALERLSSQEFGTRFRESAAIELIALQVKTEAFSAALDGLLRLPCALNHQDHHVWLSLYRCGESLPFGDVDREITSRIQAEPRHPGAVLLTALREKLAAIQPVKVTPLDLEALGVPDFLRHQALRWVGAVDAWAVSPPVYRNNWSEFSTSPDPEVMVWLGSGNGPSPCSQAWLQISPDWVSPTVRVSPGDWGDGAFHTDQASCDFITEIESPDARTVHVDFGSAGWSRIWLNGVSVQENPYLRDYLPGVDQFDLSLVKGLNRVLVRTTIRDQVDLFSFSILSGGEGLTVRSPVIPGGATVPALPTS